MAFSWWKHKKTAQNSPDMSKFLNLTDLEYAKFVAEFVENMDSATRAHVAVAYQNLLPILSATHSFYKERGEIYTVEDFIKLSSERMDSVKSDEINSRRNSWFLFAAIVARLEKISQANDQVIAFGAIIWTIIATEYPRLKYLLPKNVVWRKDEKEWFDLCDDDSDYITLVVNHHMPSIFANHPITEKFARSMNLLYWPSKGRVGYVP